MSGIITTTANPSTYKETIENSLDIYDIAKILMIGDYNVGKGAVLYRYTDNEFSGARTLGVDFKIKNIIVDDIKAMKFQIWDQNGCERFRRLSSAYYKSTHGFLLVCDLSNKESYSIKNISFWIDEINQQSQIQNPPIVIICNKCDLLNTTTTGQKDYQMVDDLTELQKHCQQLSIPLFKNASAKQDINIKESFDTLIKLVINKKDYPEGSIKHIDKTLNNNNINNNTNKSSCNIL